MMPSKSRRQALSHVGGEVEVVGDPAYGRILQYALDVQSAEANTETELQRPHLHAFHSYPARLHPETAARLIEGLRETLAPDQAPLGVPVVYDPFCGSGTVLLEGAMLGHPVVGTDLNPLAIALCRLKLANPTDAEHEALLAASANAAKIADERRTSRAGASHRFCDEDREMFAPHVLLELDGLQVGIAAQAHSLREPLRLMLSSLLTKLSRKNGDSAGGPLAEKRIAAGYSAKLFRKRTEEFVRQQREFRSHRGEPAEVVLSEDDATSLKSVRTASIDLVVTSPPYAATYDYLSHHELRLRWLGFTPKRFAEGELGARRVYSALSPAEADARWHGELSRMLQALARVTRPGAKVALVMADSALRGHPLRADDAVLDAIGDLPFDPLAKASQERPHFHLGTQDAYRDAPRREHVLLLSRNNGRY
jgi:Putative RNA methylase family UPF0020